MISLAEYAAMHGKSPVTVRQMAARGGFQTAQKIARNWIIDENEPYPDGRVKTGKYRNWRKDGRGEEKNPPFFISFARGGGRWGKGVSI